uniref:ADAM metallopeptidase with thrombospondin type 1 motif 7 n=1 Tax=Petromyzon marinus TaxID=7757 RepID=S4RPH2_PETMA
TGLIRLPRGDYFIEPLTEPPGQGTSQGRPHAVYRRHAGASSPLRANRTCAVPDSPVEANWVELHRERWEERRRRAMVPGRKIVGRSREVSHERWVEALVVADDKMVDYHRKGSTEAYVFTIMNMVAGLFREPSIGNLIKVVLVRVILLEQEEQDLKIVTNAEKTLASFCKWQKNINVGDDSHPNHHDVAILLTRPDLCCQIAQSCNTWHGKVIGPCCQDCHSVCMLRKLNSTPQDLCAVFSLPHQSLGMRHDGQGNDCEPGALGHPLVMAPHIVYDSASLGWSSCSRQYITRFLDRGWGHCLNDWQSHHFVPTGMPMVPPGVLYDASHQCRLQYGTTSAHCPRMGDVCRALWCEVGTACYTKYDAPVDGTWCGDNKRGQWCMGGECVVAGTWPMHVHGTWGPWSSWSVCSRTCGAGAQSMERQCNNPTPRFGGEYCTGDWRRYRVCNTEACPLNGTSFRQLQCSEFDKVPYRRQMYTWLSVPYPANSAHLCLLFFRKKKPVDSNFISRLLSKNIIGGGRSHNATHNHSAKTTEHQTDIASGVANGRCCCGPRVNSRPLAVSHYLACQECSGVIDICLASTGIENSKNLSLQFANNVIEMFIVTLHLFNFYNGMFFYYWQGKWNSLHPIYPYSQVASFMSLCADRCTTTPIYPQIIFSGVSRGFVGTYIVANDDNDILIYSIIYFSLGRNTWANVITKSSGGVQYREPHCTEESLGIVEKRFCDPATLPNDTRKECNTQDCPARWWTGEWQECSATCGELGLSKRSVRCERGGRAAGPHEPSLPDSHCYHRPKPKTRTPCNRGMPCPARWLVGDWSQCSVSCGGGHRTRATYCDDRRNRTACEGRARPAAMEECNLTECPSASDGHQSVPKHGVAGRQRDMSNELQPRPHFVPPLDQLLPSGNGGPLDSFGKPASTGQGHGSGEIHERNQLPSAEPESSGDKGDNSIKEQFIISSTPDDMFILEERLGASGTAPPDIVTNVARKSQKTSSTVHIINDEYTAQSHFGDSATAKTLFESPSRMHSHGYPPTSPTETTAEKSSGAHTFEMPSPSSTPMARSKRLPALDVSRSVTVGPKAPAEDFNKVTLTNASVDVAATKDSLNQRKRDWWMEMDEFTTSTTSPLATKQPSATSSFEKSNRANESPALPGHWFVGVWSECSVSCGLGAMWRAVRCSSGRLDDCDAAKRPEPARRCHVRPCAVWSVGNWSQCSEECGDGGVKTRVVQCVDAHKPGQALRPFHCHSRGYTPPTSLACNSYPCPEWSTGNWSQCSRECGGGWQHRSVTCPPGHRCNDDGDGSPKPPPIALRPCNPQPCLEWTVGRWGECSVSCDGGVQQRMVQCV